LSAALLSVATAAGCNCGYQSWRRGPQCVQQAPMAAPACDPCAGGASPGIITPYVEDTGVPTLRGTPVPGPQ
jgi:hypothetical protein